MLLTIDFFLGRFHPLIVHLPIGFLLLGLLFYLLSFKPKYQRLYVAVPVALFFGSISALMACITGYLLSVNGSYQNDILNRHLWFGIITTALAFFACFISAKKVPFAFLKSAKIISAFLLLLTVSVSLTGHLGGTLTHGQDYLDAKAMPGSKQQQRKIADLNGLYVFADLVQPVLQQKCGACHSDTDPNGGLSLTNYAAILKGGKHGAAIVPGDVAGSELIKRILLPATSKKFMPANGKTALTWQETELLRWWIQSAAHERDDKFLALNPPPAVKNYVAAVFGLAVKDEEAQYPAFDVKVAPAGKDAVQALTKLGFIVRYLSHNPDVLDVTLPPSVVVKNNSSLLASLSALKENIVWLNLSGNNLLDKDIATIGQFKNLQALRLNENPITDAGIRSLSGLAQLKSLHLYRTKITRGCFEYLAKNVALQRVYVWNSGVSNEDIAALKYPFAVIGGQP